MGGPGRICTLECLILSIKQEKSEYTPELAGISGVYSENVVILLTKQEKSEYTPEKAGILGVGHVFKV